jgi:16S rRNA (cytosine1402-N4)-methyltransferase
MNGTAHVPVLVDETLELLAAAPGQIVVDATVGSAGHARLLAERIRPGGRLIGLDRDPAMLELARQRLQGLPITLVQGSFDQLREVLNRQGIHAADAVLADLGVCSDQLERSERGFSFQQPGPLDMRLNPGEGEPASVLVNRLGERELAELFWTFGEERYSRRIARRIVEQRQRAPLQTTEQLAWLVRSCVPRSKGHPIDPATRVFQALRIAVNDELGALEGFLAVLPDCLKSGGRAVIISFHSLEDRRVKRAFANRQLWQVLTKKPVQASAEECWRNPRSRSARLRAAIRDDEQRFQRSVGPLREE